MHLPVHPADLSVRSEEKCGVVVAGFRPLVVGRRLHRFDLIAPDEERRIRFARQPPDRGAADDVVLEIKGGRRFRPHHEGRARAKRLPRHRDVPVGDRVAQLGVPLVLLLDVPLDDGDAHGIAGAQQRRGGEPGGTPDRAPADQDRSRCRQPPPPPSLEKQRRGDGRRREREQR